MTQAKKLIRDVKDAKRWADWWFINGGNIHSAWKHRQWSSLRDIAQTKPKQAWDVQQKEIDRLCRMLDIAHESLELMAGPQEFDCLIGDKSKQVVSQMALEKIEAIAKG
jgi:hypothetical protein